MHGVLARLEGFRQRHAAALVGGELGELDGVGVAVRHGDGVALRIEDLEGEAGEQHGLPSLGVLLHDLDAGADRLVVQDVAQLRAVRHLLGGDSPVAHLVEAVEHRIVDLANGIAGRIVGEGAGDALGAFALAEPQPVRLGEAVLAGGDRAHRLAGGVGDDLEADAGGRRLVAVALVPGFIGALELGDLDIERDHAFLEVVLGFELNDARCGHLL